MTEQAQFDVVGFGALNVDYTAVSTNLLDLSRRLTDAASQPGEEAELTGGQAAALLQSGMFRATMGGSALNTVRAIVSMKARVRLGFVGTAGVEPSAAVDFVDWFRTTAVDHRLVMAVPDRPPGVSISVMSQGDRYLRTAAGANVFIAEFLDDRRDEILEYLGSTRIVHLTSFLGGVGAARFVRLMKDLRHKHEHVVVSVDPGYSWATEERDAVRELLSFSDVVFLNLQELTALSGSKEDPRLAAEELLPRPGERCLSVVVKQPSGVMVAYGHRGQMELRSYSHSVIPPDQIEDATGAGDVLAAGYLMGILTPGANIDDGARLGLRLARHMLVSASTAEVWGEFAGLHETWLAGLGSA